MDTCRILTMKMTQGAFQWLSKHNLQLTHEKKNHSLQKWGNWHFFPWPALNHFYVLWIENETQFPNENVFLVFYFAIKIALFCFLGNLNGRNTQSYQASQKYILLKSNERTLNVYSADWGPCQKHHKSQKTNKQKNDEKPAELISKIHENLLQLLSVHF